MKMKFLLFFLLLLAPQSVWAQSAPKTERKASQVANLVESLGAPYLRLKTFSGTFDLSITEVNAGKLRPVLQANLQTIYRLDAAGNKVREVSLLSMRQGNAPNTILQTSKIVDDGKTQTQIDLESKLYARTPRYNEVAPFALFSATMRQIARVLREPSSVSTVSGATQAGRKITILGSKGKKFSHNLRVVIDAKSGTMQTLDFSSSKFNITLRASNQVFNAPLSESQFKWEPPTTFKKVAENQLPALMSPK